MASLSDYRRIYLYNRRVFEAYLEDLGRLPWTEAVKGRGAGHDSLAGTLQHILRVHEAWIVYVLPGRVSQMQKDRAARPGIERFPALRRESHRVWREVFRELRSLTEEDLGRRVRAPWMPGVYDVEDALMQSTLEQAHHLGELIAMYWQMDREPPQMVWILNRPPRSAPAGRPSPAPKVPPAPKRRRALRLKKA